MRSKEQSVYTLLKKIPKGKVTTYAEISRKFNLNPRQVGRILSANNHPVEFPCYKVVRSDGKVGGYTINGKNEADTQMVKLKKLLADGVNITKGRVSHSCFYSFK